MTTSTPSTPPSGQARPASRAPRRLARAVQQKVPLDAFADTPLARPAAQQKQKKKAQPTKVSPVVVLAAVAVVVGVVAVAADVAVVVAGFFAVAVAAGAWLSGRQLARFLPVAAAAAAAVTFVVVDHDAVALAAFAALSTLGFGALPRSLLFLAVRAARRAEQARADGEVLRLVDDARMFRRLGRVAHADDDVEVLADVGAAVAQRDRLYRLLRLCERSIKDTAVVALYVVDAAGTALELVEQLVTVDAENKPRLPLGGRGVGAAGLVGLCFTRRAPLRVAEGGDSDEPGSALKAHRQSGPWPHSVLCVPLLARGGACRGVVVVDRVKGAAFSADDEAFATALGAELLEGLAGEQLVNDLDAERRRVARVYAAARDLAGVTRTADVVEVAVQALSHLCPSVAVVDTPVGERGEKVARVLAATGALAPLQAGSLDGDGFAARALAERVALPHTALANAQARPILFADDGVDVTSLVDLRVVPLMAQGEARGVIVVSGERLSMQTVDAVVAVADVVALALSSARAFDAVEKQATTDGLTGVCNRRALDRRLDEAVARAKRSGQPLCVLLTDVDHFKSVNDAWGHATGDEVLKGVAKSLEAQARNTDVVGRLGGEEFVVVCEGTDLKGAITGAERMRLAIKALSFDTAKGPLSVTSSFGVALWTPGESGHDVLERADQALYKAKQQGRDRVVGSDKA